VGWGTRVPALTAPHPVAEPVPRPPTGESLVGNNGSMTTDAETYRELRGELITLARARRDDLETTAPATPEWRVRDLLAHLGGVCDDVVNGNLADVAANTWTAAQVEKRRGWTIDEVLADWEQRGGEVDALIDQAPAGMFGQLLFDAWTHGQDIRGALRAPGGQDSPAAACSYAWGTEALEGRDRTDGRPELSLVTEEGICVIGSGAPSATLRASRFELLRAMTGRRSQAQVRAFVWDGEPDPERLLLAPFFHPPAGDLVE
jgi:uncharacterized protein (TIGR03083 family)